MSDYLSMAAELEAEAAALEAEAEAIDAAQLPDYCAMDCDSCTQGSMRRSDATHRKSLHTAPTRRKSPPQGIRKTRPFIGAGFRSHYKHS